MDPFDALRAADPAEHLRTDGPDGRAEQLLREILASPATGQRTRPHAPRGSETKNRRSSVVTAAVAVAVVIAAFLAIRLVPTSPGVPAAPTSSTSVALTEAVYARLSRVATGDVPIREKSQMTWTDEHPTDSGGAIDLTGKNFYIAAACEGGGSIAIKVSGRADTVLDCDGRSVLGPLELTPDEKGSSLVVDSTGGARYVAKAMAFAPDPTRTRPTPGQILDSLSSADGRDQTTTVQANGSALTVEYGCTGSGTMTVTIGNGPGFSNDQCTGLATVRSGAAVKGSSPVTVRSTGDVTWTATVTATKPE